MKAIALLLILYSSGATADFLQRSHDVFFTRSLREKVNTVQSFPLFWWDFAVLESNQESAHAICKSLRAFLGNELTRVECEPNLSDYENIIRDWIQAQSAIFPRPTDKEIKSALTQAQAQAGLIAGSPFILELLRKDPLSRWKNLETLAKNKAQLPFQMSEGLFWDSESHRFIIPLQFSTPPTDSFVTQRIRDSLRTQTVRWVGPHFAALANEERVMKDLSIVTFVGIPLLLVLGFLLWFNGAKAFLLLIPVVFVSTAVSAVLTSLAFGGIHGLTLSFGSGIVGLALDYGLHGTLNPGSKQIWRANLYGLLTTLAGLIVMFFSGIPLIRQLMYFSIIGLSLGYFSYAFLIQTFPSHFAMRPLLNQPPTFAKPLAWPILGLALLGIIAPLYSTPSFRLDKMDYQNHDETVARDWLLKRINRKAPLVRISTPQNALEQATQERAFATANNLTVENIAQYLPPLENQRLNLSSWISHPCKPLLLNLTAEQKVFFEPFLKTHLCMNAIPMPISPALSLDPTRHQFVSHLTANQNWASAWFPKSDLEEVTVRTKYPDAFSLKEVVSTFPITLSRELRWMAPLALLLTLLLLLNYYRSLTYSLLSLLPFLTGSGLIFASLWLMNSDFTFIHLIGLLIVFGFSLDYGIFATNLCYRGDFSQISGVWSTLRLCSLVTGAGFLPFLFCKHPVLFQLGTSLFLGVLGTFAGSIWGIPGLAPWLSRWKPHSS